jgi:hypothetical protein
MSQGIRLFVQRRGKRAARRGSAARLDFARNARLTAPICEQVALALYRGGNMLANTRNFRVARARDTISILALLTAMVGSGL